MALKFEKDEDLVKAGKTPLVDEVENEMLEKY
jgi:hypothetical protein